MQRLSAAETLARTLLRVRALGGRASPGPASATAPTCPWACLALRAATRVSSLQTPAGLPRFYSKKRTAKDSKDTRGSRRDHDADGGHAEFAFDLAKWERDMAARVDRLKKDLAAMRVGRPSASLLDSVTVTHKSARVPLARLATVSVRDAQALLVVPNDDEFLAPIERAIRNANLGLNPVSTGNALKVPVPRATAETRATMVKQCKTFSETARTFIRKSRQDARTDCKKRATAASLSADALRRTEKTIQDLTDRMAKMIDQLEGAKIKEIENA